MINGLRRSRIGPKLTEIRASTKSRKTPGFPGHRFASEVRLELVDAARDVVVGALRFGVLDILQETADYDAAAWADYGKNVARRALGVEPEATAPSYARTASPNYFDDRENAYLRDRSGAPTALATWARCDLEVFGGDLWWRADPKWAPAPPDPENFSIEITRSHIQRATDVVEGIKAAYRRYEAFMRWERPGRTGAAFASFVAACVLVDAERAGTIPGRAALSRSPSTRP